MHLSCRFELSAATHLSSLGISNDALAHPLPGHLQNAIISNIMTTGIVLVFLHALL